MSAYSELMDYLMPGESVEAIAFGPYGWGYAPDEGRGFVPAERQGEVMSLGEAMPYLTGSWAFDGGFGGAECHAVTIWTDKRVIFVVTYDGATRLASVPRDPAHMVEPPALHGGG